MGWEYPGDRISFMLGRDSRRQLEPIPVLTTLLPTENEMKQFEDDPLESVRLDLSFPGSSAGATADVTTRGQAAAAVRPPGAGTRAKRRRSCRRGLGLGWLSMR